MAQIDSYTPHDFPLTEMQTIFGREATDAITAANADELLHSIESCKSAMPECADKVKKDLMDRLAAPFSPASHVYGDYKDAIEG